MESRPLGFEMATNNREEEEEEEGGKKGGKDQQTGEAERQNSLRMSAANPDLG